jgi:ABC-type bacteriocin/lantibiotic exporter with double-glycine peptidase domain
MKLANISGIFYKYSDAIVYAFILNILLFVPSLLSPIYKKIFTDYILIDHDTGWLFMLLAMMSITAVFAGAANWLQRNCLARLSNGIEINKLNEYMKKMFCKSPFRLFTEKDSYTLLSKSEKSKSISKLLTKDILSLLFDIFRVVFYMILMIRIDITMSVIVVLLVVANILFGKAGGFLREKLASKENNAPVAAAAAQGEQLYVQGLQNIEMYKSSAAESVLFKRLLGENTAKINSKRKDDFQEACSPIEDLPEIIFLNLLLVISALRIMDRSFSIGTYLAFQAYASAFFYPLNGVLSARAKLLKFEKTIAGYFKELGKYEEEKPAVHAKTGKNTMLEGYIEFKNVFFSYEKNMPIIKDFNLSIKPGQRVAVIGKSGTGKTTLLKLLQGLYEPDCGEITIDGIPASRIDRDLFKNSAGCANQDTAIFSASIRENITMWDDSITETDLYNAAHDACIHKYISSLEGAYEYQLTENGNNISRGQCQKIEITRALIYNPSIVIFDEALRSIEPEAREHIQKVLLKRGCTCLVVTHLLSQVLDYDEIIVLDKDKDRPSILARGKHEELMNISHFYRTLLEAEKAAVTI